MSASLSSSKPNTQIHSPNKTFTIPISSSKQVTIRIIEPSVSAQGLSLTTWTSSWVLARQLHKLDLPVLSISDIPSADPDSVSLSSTTTNPIPPFHAASSTSPSPSPPSTTTTMISQPPIIPILELGAGTGLVGITASIVLRQPVILTDLAPIITGLEANVALNQALLDEQSAVIYCGNLDWSQPSSLSIPNLSDHPNHSIDSIKTPDPKVYLNPNSKVNLLLAADTIYSDEHPELISDVIVHRLAKLPTARAVLTYALRVAYLDQIRELWERLETAGLECVTEGQIDGRVDGSGQNQWSGDWDDEVLCEWCVWRWKD